MSIPCRAVLELIDRIRERRPQMSVLVATAYMEEPEQFHWLAAMDDGHIIATGSPAEVRARADSPRPSKRRSSLCSQRRSGRLTRLWNVPRVSQPGPPSIEAEGLTKRFGSFTAVDHVSFRIEKGEIFGFLGSNGCGKSTTMKMLTGLLQQQKGRQLTQASQLTAKASKHVSE